MAKGSDSDDMRPDDRLACLVALACTLVSAVFIVTGGYYLYKHSDQRVTLTTLDVFHDWGVLQGIFRDATHYTPLTNPASLDHIRFDEAPDTLMVYRDLHSRGLISDADYLNISSMFNQTTGVRLNVFAGTDPAAMLAHLASITGANIAAISSVFNNSAWARLIASGGQSSLLLRLLSTAGCTFPDALPGTTPATRSRGCQCIADAYLGFVRAAANMSSNVSAAVRDSSAADVLRCVDRRVTWHTWGCGEEWSVHPLGLMVYCDCIHFLCCVAFLLSFYHERLFPVEWDATPKYKVWAIKGILSAMGMGFIVLFAARDWQANLFVMLGLLLALVNLVFSISSALDYVSKGGSFLDEWGPHPLMVCFWVNAPVLLPGLTVVVAVSGFIRDFYAVCAVGVIGAVLGLIMQRMFWSLWYVPTDHDDMRRLGRFDALGGVAVPLACGFCDLFLCLVLILLAYLQRDGVYYMSGGGGFFALVFFVSVLFMLLLVDFYVCRERIDMQMERNQYFGGGGQTYVFVLTQAILAGLTVATILDAELV